MPDSVATSLRITIVTPAVRGSGTGNRVTALRWAGLLRQLGHRVAIANQWHDHPTDVLIAVHAVKTAAAVLKAGQQQPGLRIVTLLAGTDIYPTFAPDEETQRALARANALVALQPRAMDLLPPELLLKCRTIVQSATAPKLPRNHRFTATVLAHLRSVKQPLVAVEAMARVPKHLEIDLVLAGEQLDSDYAKLVQLAIAGTSRASWLGALSRTASKMLLARSHVAIVPSQAEGGANVISEAIAAGTPILCSEIPGNLGLLGNDWPATFAVGDAAALAQLIERAATDPVFLDMLCLRIQHLQPMVSPQRERHEWQILLAELAPF